MFKRDGFIPMAILISALTVHAIAAVVSFVRSVQPASDFERYYAIGSTQGRPYVDYPVEHPIGTFLVFKALAAAGDRPFFGRAAVTTNAVCDVTIVAALWWGWGAVAAAGYALAVIPVIGLLFNRIDALSAASAALAVAAWRRDRPALAGTALALGATFKLWPLVLAPIVCTAPPVPPARWPRVSPRTVAAFAFTGAAAAVIAVGLGGTHSLVDVLTFRGARGWQIESVIGNLIELRGGQTPRWETGAWRIGVTSGPVSIALFMAAAPLCFWSAWRGAVTGRVGTAWLAAVCSLLVLSALLSAQFVMWLAPAIGIVWAGEERLPAVVAAFSVVATLAFYGNYDAVLEGSRAALLLIAARNVLLMVTAVVAFRGTGDRSQKSGVRGQNASIPIGG